MYIKSNKYTAAKQVKPVLVSALTSASMLPPAT